MMYRLKYLTKKVATLGMVFQVMFVANLFAQKNKNEQYDFTHRKGEIVVKAKPGAKIQIEQQEHEFWFGCAISDGIFNGRASEADVKMYKQIFLQNFNSAVTENAVKWSGMERQKGEVDYSLVDAMLDWTEENNLPIKFTEFNMPGQRSKYYQNRDLEMTEEKEQQKAKDLVDYYRICFAHPSVDGILMWGFWEGANWIPQSSLYKRDWSPTPAAEAYQFLIFDEWWTNVFGTTNNGEKISIPAFFGKYKITVDGKTKEVDLKKAEGRVVVEF